MAPPAVDAMIGMPVNGRITSRVGWRIDPIYGGVRMHRGVDIAAPRGTPVLAPASGRVVFSGRGRGYGNMLILEHTDGTQSLYAHLDRAYVHKGETVAPGRVIAAVGATGRATGPHLHFERRAAGRAIDPLAP